MAAHSADRRSFIATARIDRIANSLSSRVYQYANTADVAATIDGLKFADNIPFLHVSSLEGPGRKSSEQLSVLMLLEFIELVLSHLSQFSEWLEFVTVEGNLSPILQSHGS